MINHTEIRRLYLKVHDTRVELNNSADFKHETDTVHAGLSDERKAKAAKRSREAYAQNNVNLGDRWRQRSRREGRKGELWKPFSKGSSSLTSRSAATTRLPP